MTKMSRKVITLFLHTIQRWPPNKLPLLLLQPQPPMSIMTLATMTLASLSSPCARA